MGFLNKRLTLTFIVYLILASLFVLLVTPAEVGAESEPSSETVTPPAPTRTPAIPGKVYFVSKPLVPQFSVKFIDKSYGEPPTQTTDPYTEQTITQPGYPVNDGLIEIRIKNQPVNPETDRPITYDLRLYYRVEAKDSFGGNNDWYSLARTDTGYIEQSDSEYTIFNAPAKYDSNIELDIRVKAISGVPRLSRSSLEIVEVESSDWSEIQTITITYGSLSTTPSQTANLSENPSETPADNNQSQIPDFMWHPLFLLGASVLFVGVVVTMALVFIRRYRTPQTSIKQQIHKSLVNFSFTEVH